MQKTDLEDFVKAWKEGRVCLHPTDTLLGLSFNPQSPLAAQNFAIIKARAPDKSPISLIGSWDLALRLWQPLPAAWALVLPKLWPASLSVIWKASGSCPQAIVAANGTCGLRLPRFHSDLEWMENLLRALDQPFPSSSVNLSGQAAIGDWATAVQFLKAEARDESMVFVPELSHELQDTLSKRASPPSTLIRIEDDGSWSMLREGAVTRATIQSTWELYAKRS